MFEDVPSLSVLPFFSIAASLYRLPKGKKTFFTKDYLLPSSAAYTGEKENTSIYAAWTDDKLLFHFEIKGSFEKADSEFRKGDSIELFIDTRDIKSRRFMTSFCHHFVIFPEKVDGFFIKEVTRFRTDDVHALASSKDIAVTAGRSKSSCIIDAEFPHDVLHGYNPQEFNRLGFTYKINYQDKETQNFAFSSLEYLPENNPQMWGTLHLSESS